ncbi:MAG: type I glyceraldehyde-3-phosphate dehydrogenase [Brevinemataceae bacterium]
MAKIAINGFGRIGRCTLRAYLANYSSQYEIVAINDLTDPQMLVHLFKYDSTYGPYKGDVKLEGDYLVVAGKKIKLIAEKDPKSLPWKEMGVDIVIESTGIFTKREHMQMHIEAGAKKVLLSAPAASADDVDLTTVIGVNHEKITKEMQFISNASCTTNSMAGVTKAINDALGIISGFMTTIHSYTMDQNLLDSPHRKGDQYRARAAAENIVPSSTGAAKAIGLVIPELKGKLDGGALRIPTPVGSITDLTFEVSKATSVKEVNEIIKKASESYLKGTVEYSEEALVLKDIVGNPHSSIFHADLTKVGGSEGKTVKVFAWYDNEWGFSNRLAHLCKIVADKL